MASTVGNVPFIAGNYFDKYRSENPLYRGLMSRFVRDAKEMVGRSLARSVVEVGCGPGDLASRILSPDANSVSISQYTGVDISREQVELARSRYPQLKFHIASAYDLPFADRSVDLVIVCEVLEHLERPAAALAEAARVTRGYVLVSVPWEPTWRMLNVLRCKYWSALGNTPGHIQNFTRQGIQTLVSGQLEIIAERRPFPWTMLLARRLEEE